MSRIRKNLPHDTTTTGVVRVEPIAVRRTDAAALLGIGLSTFEQHVSRGLLPRPRQIGKRVVWLVDELRSAAYALPQSELLPPPPRRPGGADM